MSIFKGKTPKTAEEFHSKITRMSEEFNAQVGPKEEIFMIAIAKGQDYTIGQEVHVLQNLHCTTGLITSGMIKVLKIWKECMPSLYDSLMKDIKNIDEVDAASPSMSTIAALKGISELLSKLSTPERKKGKLKKSLPKESLVNCPCGCGKKIPESLREILESNDFEGSSEDNSTDNDGPKEGIPSKPHAIHRAKTESL